MSRNNPIDKETGRLKDYAVSSLYLYIGEQFKHRRKAYKRFRYADLARHVGLPWLPSGDNNAVIALLRAALARIETPYMIHVKPDTHDTVLVRLLRSPDKLRRRYGDDYVWHCFVWERDDGGDTWE